MNVPFKPILDKRGEPHVQRFNGAALGARQHHPRQRNRLGPAAFALSQRRHAAWRPMPTSPASASGCRRWPTSARRSRRWRAAARPRRRPPKRPAALVTARDNYFMAAIHWGAAQWPYDENDETNIAYNNKKRECYTQVCRARRPQGRGGVDSVQGQRDPRLVPSAARLHRRAHSGGDRDSRHGQFQGSAGRALRRPLPQPRHGGAGDRRAGAIRSADARRLFLGRELGRRRQAGGRLAQQPARDRCGADRLHRHQLRHVLRHHPHRARAAHQGVRRDGVCHEPGCHTIFQEASPTFKKRFMYMSGIVDEAEFDKFRQGITWEGHADKIKVPYLCLAGEDDELSPVRAFGAADAGGQGAEAVRGLSGRQALARQRAGRQSRAVPDDHWSPTGWPTASPASHLRASAGTSP